MANGTFPAHHTAEVNGVRLHYVTAGAGDPVVLLHGWPQTWHEWRHLIPALASRYTVVAPDLRGFGDSDKPAAATTSAPLPRTFANWRVTSASAKSAWSAQLIAGDFDIAHTAFDNVVAYVERQADASVRNKPDLVAFMGGDNGLLRLVTKPDIRSYADLEGKQLSVDTLTTGYAFVLRRMLERHGLRDNDYELVSVGGGMERWQALQAEGGPVGTLLMTPFELLAKDKGFKLLGDASEEIGPCQGLVGAANRAWAAAHADDLVAYIRAYLTSWPGSTIRRTATKLKTC